jgi:RNA polymerase sigma-70 factor (ECF subfamily)
MSDSLFSSFTSLFSISDEQAMWRVQTHDDAQAFAQIVHRWEGPIQRLCTRMTGDAHRGEDLAQETFAKLFSRRKAYQCQGRFSTFLWRVAVNLCYDELRKINRRSESSFEAESDESLGHFQEFVSIEPAPDQNAAERERNDFVRQAVMRLPEAYRTVIVLRHFENLKFREIADVLEIPEGTVKSRMAEALSQLSRLLSHSLAEKNSPSTICKTPIKRIEESLIL